MTHESSTNSPMHGGSFLLSGGCLISYMTFVTCVVCHAGTNLFWLTHQHSRHFPVSFCGWLHGCHWVVVIHFLADSVSLECVSNSSERAPKRHTGTDALLQSSQRLGHGPAGDLPACVPIPFSSCTVRIPDPLCPATRVYVSHMVLVNI